MHVFGPRPIRGEVKYSRPSTRQRGGDATYLPIREVEGWDSRPGRAAPRTVRDLLLRLLVLVQEPGQGEDGRRHPECLEKGSKT